VLWLAQPSVFVKPFPCFNLRIVATYPRSAHLPIWNHQPGASGSGYAHLLWRKQFLAIGGCKSFRWAFFFHCRGFWDRRKESFAFEINSATSSSALSFSKLCCFDGMGMGFLGFWSVEEESGFSSSFLGILWQASLWYIC